MGHRAESAEREARAENKRFEWGRRKVFLVQVPLIRMLFCDICALWIVLQYSLTLATSSLLDRN